MARPGGYRAGVLDSLRRGICRRADHSQRSPRYTSQPELPVPLTGALPRGLSLRGVLRPALLAAIAAGAVATVLQQIFLVPLILQAESLEVAGDLHAVAEVGLQRAGYTLLFNCLGAFGFALLLAGCYALRGGVTGAQ